MAAQAPVPASGARRRRRQGLLRRILIRGGRLTRVARRAVGCAGAGLLALATPAEAQGCRQTAPGVFACTGPITQAQSLSAQDGPLAATLSGDDPVDVLSGTALTLTGDGSVSLVQASGAAPVRGAEAGVHATLLRGGSLTVDLAGSATGGASGIVASATGGAARIAVAGTVEGTAQHGILAEANSVDVRAGTARGALSGVHAAIGSGTAAIAVDTVAATASGTGIRGIHLRTGAGAAGAAVSAGRVASGGHGIVVIHAGSATASVAGGAVRAALDGIALTASGTGGAAIRAGTVDAASGTAIRLEGAFTGGASISATGRIAGGGDAVRVRSDGGAGASGTRRSLAISVTEATGGADGVWASFEGDGDLAISATGSVTGGAGRGIHAATGARTRRLTISAADVSGAIIGIHAVHRGRSMLSIAASGSVTGGAAEGIRAAAHPGADAGSGDASPGIRIAAATVSGATYGIHAVNRSTGPMTISATGPVSGRTHRGLNVTGGGAASSTTVSAALVSGARSGARFEQFGQGDLTISIASARSGYTGIRVIRGGGGNTQLTVGSVKAGGTGVHIQTFGWGKHALSVGSVDSATIHGIDLNNQLNNTISLSVTGTIIARGRDGIRNFSANSTGHYGNHATNSVTIANATVTGAANGIYSLGGGNMDLSISASGPVTGLTQAGIRTHYQWQSGGRRTTISATDVTGASWGIKIQQSGHARLSITTSGSVTGRTRSGIDVIANKPRPREYGLPKDIALTTATVTGAENGIEVSNERSGTLAISAVGPVTGKSGTGIQVSGNSDAQSITISAALVSGGHTGINVNHAGSGDISISADEVVGKSGRGVDVSASSKARSLTITAGSVTAGRIGIAAFTQFTGSVRISAGQVTGSTGILLRAAGSEDVFVTAGSIYATHWAAVDLVHFGAGNLSLSATGHIFSQNRGAIFFRNKTFGVGSAVRGRGVAISVATVTGGLFGIKGELHGHEDISISASGPVTGHAESGIRARSQRYSKNTRLNVASVSGGIRGLDIRHHGRARLTISASGSVTGGISDGIRAESSYYVASPPASPQFSPTLNVSVAAATVTGAEAGMYIINARAGTLSISATGSVTGTARSGILAKNVSFSHSTTISAASASGADAGIHAVHMGYGDLRISATGKAVASSATYGVAIRAEGLERTGDVSVSAAAATGGKTGILARNLGTGSLRVMATGDVVGKAAEGILAVNERGIGVAVAAASVDGATHGIAALSSGTGDLSVAAAGSVTGRSGDGIRAFAETRGRDLTVAAASVTGASHGIFARNLGSGATSVSATGMVAGGSAAELHGVLAYNTATGAGVSVSVGGARGSKTGVTARNEGAGSLMVAATGSVTGGASHGIHARNAERGASLTVAAADVTGAGHGILAENLGSGATSVSATGMVAGGSAAELHGVLAYNTATGAGVSVSVGGARGSKTGVTARNEGAGSLMVAATGSVTGGASHGIHARNAERGASLTVAAADVTGAGHGILAENLGSGATSVSATGMVAGGSAAELHGVLAYNTATGAGVSVSVGGARGSKTGVTARNEGAGSLMVAATGSVTGGASHGIHARNAERGASLTVAAADVTGAGHGILAENLGSGATSVSATGMVAGGSAAELHGVLAYNTATGAGVSVSVGGARGSKTGVTARNEGAGSLMVAATGSVTGGASHGIHARNAERGASLTVAAADVTGAGHGILAENLGSGATSVSATGMVAGGSAAELHGVLAYNTATGAGVSVSVGGARGSKTGVTARNEGAGSLMVAATGSVTGGASHGIHARNAERGASLTVAAADVTGAGHGILAENLGSGATSVSATGMVAGGSAAELHGVLAYNTATGAGVSVSVGGARGSKTGVTARNEGAGSLMVAATGSVTGGASHGIHARNAERGASLTVAAADVTGAGHGILAENLGSGATSVSAAGMVASGSGALLHGIVVHNTKSGGDVEVAVAEVRGAQTGIDAQNLGAGTLSVTATGFVRGGRHEGIAVRSASGGTGLTISAADVFGQRTGMSAEHYGSGDLLVTATGMVRGRWNRGIYAFNDDSAGNLTIAAASVTGDIAGIVAFNLGTGATSVTATGHVESVATGYYLRGDGISVEARHGDVTVAVADVTGQRKGIRVSSSGAGHLSVAATGTVRGLYDNGIEAFSGSSGAGLAISAASAIGVQSGIVAEAEGGGSLFVAATGRVTGHSADGILARSGSSGSSLTVSVASVTGGRHGIFAENRGTGITRVSAAGLVTGGGRVRGHGILAQNTANGADVFVSAARVRGEGGIAARNVGAGDISVIATGSVTADSDNGIFADNGRRGGNVTVKAAAVTGGISGILASNFGSGTTSISATGPVSGGTGVAAHGIYALNGATAVGAFVSAATVTGGRTGITVTNEGAGRLSIAASGSVTGRTDNGVLALNRARGASLSVSVASVTGVRHGIQAENRGTGAVRVTATGLVAGGSQIGQHGITAYGGSAGTDVFVSAADVRGGTGITAQNAGAGAVTIAATGTVTAYSSFGVFVSNGWRGSSLTVTVATVASREHGILASNFGSGATSVSATGPVSGGTGATAQGILAFNRAAGVGVGVSAATVTGGGTGITARNDGAGALSIAASGSVTGRADHGVFARSGTRGSSLTVSVAAVTARGHGILAQNLGTGAISVSATGPVAGGAEADPHGILSDSIPIESSAAAGHDGIHAQGAPSGTDLTVSAAAAVTGGNRGIRADNRGGGATVISADGLVRGERGDGIAVDAGAAAGRMVVSAASVSGGGNGLTARSLGAGAMLIRASGRVAGHHGDGITASGNGGLDIGVQAVEGHEAGVVAANGGRGSVVIAAADAVTGRGGGGIVAANGADGLNLEISAAAVRGAASGIAAENLGSGALSVAAAGLVASQDGTGIRAYNGLSGTDLAISGRSVSAQSHGVDAVNKGAGNLSIRLAGAAESDLESGISARNSETGVGLSVGAATAMGRRHGIFAHNMGIGDLSVSVTGTVSGATRDGLYAYNSRFGLNLAIAAGSVEGFDNGVLARNVGNGALSVAVSSQATGGLNTGIRAHNSASGTDLAVAAGSANGRRFGIVAENSGHGSLSIVASGAVSGIVDDGIHAVNGASGSDLTISAAEVSGRTIGIRAENDGSGSLRISAARSVSGGAGGAVLVRSGARGADVDVHVAAATGNSFGIRVRSMGLGAVGVTATGAVAGETNDGIEAYGGPAARGLTIKAADVRGRERGIQANLAGLGSMLIAATGAVAGVRGTGILARSGSRGDRIEISASSVSGGTNGIEAVSENRQDILISVSGAVTGGTGAGVVAMTRGGRTVVTLRSGASADAASGVAIRNNDDPANVTAMAGSAIRGAVLLGGGADALAFDGGRLDPDALLDGGSDPASANGPESIDVLRLGGRHRSLIARHLQNWERIVVEARGLVSFQGRQTLRTGVFHNRGTLSMRDGNAGDSLTIDGSFGGGGSLALDVDFALGRADRLTITGNALGAATAVTVSRTGGSDSGANGAIVLIGVGGATEADAFALSGGELRSGSRAYSLAYLTDRRQFALVPSPTAPAAKSGQARAPAAVPQADAGNDADGAALLSAASAFGNPAPSLANPPVPPAPEPGAGASAGTSPQGGGPAPNMAKAAVPPLSRAGATPAIAAPALAIEGTARPGPAIRRASARAASPASAPAASAKAPAAAQAATTAPAPAAPRAKESAVAAAAASVQAARPADAAATEIAAPPSAQSSSPAERAPAPVASGAGASAPAPAASAAPAAAQAAKADPASASGAPATPRARESDAAPAAGAVPSTRPANAAATAIPAPPGAQASPPAKRTEAPAAPTQTTAAATAQTASTSPARVGGDPAAARAGETAAAPTATPMRADPAAATTAHGAADQPGAGAPPQAAAPEAATGSDSAGSSPAEAGPDVIAAAKAAAAARTGDSRASAPAAAAQPGAGTAPQAETEADTRTAAPTRAQAESAVNPGDGAAPAGAVSAVFLRMASVALLEGFARTPTHLQRRWESGDPDPGGAWMLTRDNAGGYADTAAGAIMTTRGGSVQGGTILAKFDGQRGDWIFGAKARRMDLSAVVHERGGAGIMESRGYGTGATATWLGRSGVYVDLQAQINRIQSEFLSFGGGPPAPNAKSRIYGTSIETGAPVPVREGLVALPHAQIGWNRLESAPTERSSAETPSLETGETISALVGLGLELRTENIDARLTGGLLHDFSDVPGDGAHERAFSASRAEFGVGATFLLGGGALLIKATHRMPLDNKGSGGGSSLSAGMRWNWN